MGGKDRVWNEHVHAATYKKYNQQGPNVYSTWNSTQCYVVA